MGKIKVMVSTARKGSGKPKGGVRVANNAGAPIGAKFYLYPSSIIKKT